MNRCRWCREADILCSFYPDCRLPGGEVGHFGINQNTRLPYQPSTHQVVSWSVWLVVYLFIHLFISHLTHPNCLKQGSLDWNQGEVKYKYANLGFSEMRLFTHHLVHFGGWIYSLMEHPEERKIGLSHQQQTDT